MWNSTRDTRRRDVRVLRELFAWLSLLARANMRCTTSAQTSAEETIWILVVSYMIRRWLALVDFLTSHHVVVADWLTLVWMEPCD